MRCDICGRTADFAFAFCPYCGATARRPAEPVPPLATVRPSRVSFDTQGTFYVPIEPPAAGGRSQSGPAAWGSGPGESRGVLRLDADGLSFTPELGPAAVVDGAGRETVVVGSRRVRPGDTIVMGGTRLLISGQEPAADG